MVDAHKYDPLNPASESYSGFRETLEDIRDMNSILQQTKEERKKAGAAVVLVDRWYYIDQQSSATQGPFSSEQMIGWKAQGFFTEELLVRNGEGAAGKGGFRPLAEWDLEELGRVEREREMEERVRKLREVEVEAVVEEGEEEEGKEEEDMIEQRLQALRGGQAIVEEIVEEVNEEDESENGAEREQYEGEVVDMFPNANARDDEEEEEEEEEEEVEYPVADYPGDDDLDYPADVGYPADVSYPAEADLHPHPGEEDQDGAKVQVPAADDAKPTPQLKKKKLGKKMSKLKPVARSAVKKKKKKTVVAKSQTQDQTQDLDQDQELGDFFNEVSNS